MFFMFSPSDISLNLPCVMYSMYGLRAVLKKESLTDGDLLDTDIDTFIDQVIHLIEVCLGLRDQDADY